MVDMPPNLTIHSNFISYCIHLIKFVQVVEYVVNPLGIVIAFILCEETISLKLPFSRHSTRQEIRLYLHTA